MTDFEAGSMIERKKKLGKEEITMSFERAAEYVRGCGLGDRIKVFPVSSATVELAAQAVGVEPGRIAKSLTFRVGEDPVMILCAGDWKIDNPKYKAKFSTKAKMLAPDEVERLIGHAVGGVCPFGRNENVAVYLDESLKRFATVFPAAGSGNSAIEMTISELEETSLCAGWVDVAKEAAPA